MKIKQFPKPVKRYGVTLNLTLTEAKVLMDVLENVGGDPDRTRGITDGMLRKISVHRKEFDKVEVDLRKENGFDTIYYV